MKTILTALFSLMFVLNTTQTFAKSRSIAGSWRGGGHFTTSSGAKEKTRCRATIRAKSFNRYTVHAKCSVASLGLIVQSGTVKSVGKNRYRGRFTNYDYNIKGSINIVIRGNRQYITLRSPQGGGNLVLRRR